MERKLKINLLYHKGHNNVVISLIAAFGDGYFCEECHLRFNRKQDHRCVRLLKNQFAKNVYGNIGINNVTKIRRKINQMVIMCATKYNTVPYVLKLQTIGSIPAVNLSVKIVKNSSRKDIYAICKMKVALQSMILDFMIWKLHRKQKLTIIPYNMSQTVVCSSSLFFLYHQQFRNVSFVCKNYQ